MENKLSIFPQIDIDPRMNWTCDGDKHRLYVNHHLMKEIECLCAGFIVPPNLHQDFVRRSLPNEK